MANIIKLKRGPSTNISSLTLEQGEIALTTDTNEILSINKDGVIESITPHLLNSSKKIKSELIDFPTSVSGNAGSANKVNNSLTLMKNGANTTFDGSVAQMVKIPTIHYGVGTPADTLGQDGDIYIIISEESLIQSGGSND